MAPLQHVSVFCLLEVRVNGARAVSPVTSALRRDVPGVARVGTVAPTPRPQFASAAAGAFTCWPVSRCCERRSHRYPSTPFLPPPPPCRGFPGAFAISLPSTCHQFGSNTFLKSMFKKSCFCFYPWEGSCQALSSFSCASDKSLSEWPR